MGDSTIVIDFVDWLGVLAVLLVATGRFNNPRLLIGDASVRGNTCSTACASSRWPWVSRKSISCTTPIPRPRNRYGPSACC